MNILTRVCLWIAIVGALNWGLVGLFNFNLVSFIFGASIFTQIIYIIVGLAGVWIALKDLNLIPERD